MEKNIWGFHNPINNEEILINNSYIAIGWCELGDLKNLTQTRDGYTVKYNEVYPDEKKQSVANCVGQLYRFVQEVKVGDYIIFPTKYNRMINIGEVTGDYYYENDGSSFPNKRNVRWIKKLPRESFSQGALYEAGSFLTVFRIKHYADEYLNALENRKTTITVDSEEAENMVTAEGIKELTKDFVLSELKKIYKGYDLENVVADLLKAMGYRTKISQHGGDSGRDIIAYKDELPPRIIVQVKSQESNITEATVQSLKGTMDEGDYGLFVTLSDYQPNAKKYLEKHPIIKSINGSEFVDLILKYYDDMSDEFKDNIRLKRVLLPELKDDSEEE